MLTQRPFLRFSELQVRVDGVIVVSRHRNAVDVAVRESTRPVPRRRRDAVGRRRYAAGWSHEDVARARSSTPSLVAEPEPVQLRNREVVRKAPRSRVDDISERKTLRKKRRCDEFLQQNRSQSGGRDLDGRDEEVRALIRKDWKLRSIIDESRREIQAYRGRVVTLAYGDLLGQLRAVACVEEVASVLRREFGEAVSVDAIHLDLKTTFSRY